MATSSTSAWLLGLALGVSSIASAQVAVPALTARVTDQTATLTINQIQLLEQTLQAFEARKGSQIAVLIVPSTAPETVEQYALRVAEQWKLGRTKIEDGAIVVVAKNDRALRIEVGYGLEGALNDATSKRIVSEIIVPRFQQGNFYGGITDGINRVIQVVDGEPLPPPKADDSATAGTEVRQYAPVLLLLALIVGSFLRSTLGKVPGALVTGGVLGFLVWLLAGAVAIGLLAGVIGFLFTLLGGGMAGGLIGGMGGRGHGGGGFGGMGGGGFSGGGGGFGGGGASGRW